MRFKRILTNFLVYCLVWINYSVYSQSNLDSLWAICNDSSEFVVNRVNSNFSLGKFYSRKKNMIHH